MVGNRLIEEGIIPLEASQVEEAGSVGLAGISDLYIIVTNPCRWPMYVGEIKIKQSPKRLYLSAVRPTPMLCLLEQQYFIAPTPPPCCQVARKYL